jgi:hypothetical protein
MNAIHKLCRLTYVHKLWKLHRGLPLSSAVRDAEAMCKYWVTVFSMRFESSYITSIFLITLLNFHVFDISCGVCNDSIYRMILNYCWCFC